MPWLSDDGHENNNYIAGLFILGTAHSNNSFHYLNCFLEQKLTKALFVLSFLKLKFQGKWNLRLGKIKRANSANSLFWGCAQL